MTRIFLIVSVLVPLLIITYAAFFLVRLRLNIVRSGVLVERSRAFEQHPNHPRLQILILGDSTAVGTGVSDPRGSIAGLFGMDFPDADIQNNGVNGMRVQGLEKNFPSFPKQSFDLVLLQIGANDITKGTPLPEFSASLSSIFYQAKNIGRQLQQDIMDAPVLGDFKAEAAEMPERPAPRTAALRPLKIGLNGV